MEEKNTPSTIYENDKFAMVEIVPLDLTDADPVEEVPEVVRPTTGEEATFECTFTPESAAALAEMMKPAIDMAWGMAITLFLVESMNPKWWYLYKHAKKRRVRKKYRNRLVREVVHQMRAANAERERDA